MDGMFLGAFALFRDLLSESTEAPTSEPPISTEISTIQLVPLINSTVVTVEPVTNTTNATLDVIIFMDNDEEVSYR